MGRTYELVITEKRPVVDGTVLSSAQLRAEIREQLEAQQDGRDDDLARERVELRESLERLDSGLQALRERLKEKAVRAAKIAGGVVGVGAALTGAAIVWWKRSAPE
ncbi:hypothetical protein LWC35_33950 [Pseudonocardia kujensis]|uniref:hypothetical protein n=1 Tax=Pseudonocardia kujensis TaxID=1128675 RepID=UPI001E41DF8F|nr:hypothetical protein [Pseudonocardia kujensis]MCE0767867.1 hypothetical protein [Pseudonocardia kujensis]